MYHVSRNEEAANAHRYLAMFYAVMFLIIGVMLFTAHPSLVDIVAFLAISVFLIAFHYLVSKGAEACKPWARIASLVVGCFMLIGFPIGTAIGGYLIYVSSSKWQPRVFESGSIYDLLPPDQKSERNA